MRAAVDLPEGRFVYATLPPHRADGCTSESAPFAVGVAFIGQRDAVVADGGGTRRLDLPPGGVGVGGAEPLHWLHTPAPSESVEFEPSTTALALAAREHGADWTRLRTYRAADDPVVWALSAAARRELHRADPDRPVLCELAARLLARLARGYAGGVAPPSAGIELTRCRLVAARVRASPFAAHPLDDLAAVVHLAPHHFLRCFARTTDLTPHAFVTAVRAEEVRRRLARPGASVAQVAADIGMDPRQLRRVHHRAIGTSPRDVAIRSRGTPGDAR